MIALDGVLGADLDTPQTPVNRSLIDRGAVAATQAAAQQVRGAAESVVPFRGWVRYLSGAERYSREVVAAIAALAGGTEDAGLAAASIQEMNMAGNLVSVSRFVSRA